MGRIALGVAIAGFIFACIPGALIIGWVLLPVAFILGIVGATRTGQRKGGSIAAIIISIVGVIVGVVVFLAVVAGAVDEAFDAATGGETTAIDGDEAAPDAAADEDGATDDAANAADEAADDETADDAAAGPAGTREDPFPFDSVIANNEWSVELSGFDADADEEIAAASQVNDAPGEGYRWVTVDAAATYVGAASGNVLEVSVDYVAADGTVISAHDEFVMGLEPEFDSLAEPLRRRHRGWQGSPSSCPMPWTASSASRSASSPTRCSSRFPRSSGQAPDGHGAGRCAEGASQPHRVPRVGSRLPCERGVCHY
ncbi:hypothetical protein [Demequina litorisediminis]|uniref:DUF4190 domain-containing protein n=1 Tax=Demequina litorisediminis TaxID=1849022 RepID=A0ABQ6IDJ7_9MICO|nr:hypothetical protein [Demequina litorisediminis]GMA35937.1 hypothetical protein GCM10025876_21410 [Demequina litorisediminis]